MKEEKYELSHEAVQGYKPVFVVVFIISVIYLAVVFSSSL